MAAPTNRTKAKRDNGAYILRLLTYDGRPANPGITVDGINILNDLGEFQFPPGIQQVTYTAQARKQVYATSEGNEADTQGLNPPTIQLSGTFGEGLKGEPVMDGRQWQRALELLIEWYLLRARKAGVERIPPHKLEWVDTYKDQAWIVTPEGVPYGRRDASGPYKEQFDLRLQALYRADQKSRATADNLQRTMEAGAPGLCPYDVPGTGCRFGGAYDSDCPYRQDVTA